VARYCIQVPLATAALIVTLATLMRIGIVVLSDDSIRGMAWLVTTPVAGATFVALRATWGVRARSTSTAVVLAVVGAAMVTGLLTMLGMAPGPDGQRWMREPNHWLPVRDAILIWSAWFATVGLTVTWSVRGLILGRCVINCVHAPRLVDEETRWPSARGSH
jgi:hypothetical protein